MNCKFSESFKIILPSIIHIIIIYVFRLFSISVSKYSIIFVYFMTLVTLYRRDKKVCIILFLGYIFRLLIMYIDIYFREIIELPHTGDAYAFYQSGLYYLGKGTIFIPNIYGGLYSKFIGSILILIGDNRFVLQHINIILNMITIDIFLKLMDYLIIKDKAKFTLSLIYTFAPMHMIISAVMMRESIIIFFVSLSLLNLIIYCQNLNDKDFYFSIMFILLGSLFHSGILFLGLGYIYIFFTLKIEINYKEFIYILIGFLMLFSIIYINRDTLLLKFFKNGELNISYGNYKGASSLYLPNIKINNLIDALKYGPLRFIYFFISPTPLYWRGITDLMSFLFDSIIFIVYLFKTIKYMIVNNKSKYKNLVYGLIISGYLFGFVFGLGVNNSGTAIRHRNKILILVLLTLAFIDKDYKKIERSLSMNNTENITINNMIDCFKKNLIKIILITVFLGGVAFGFSEFVITPRYTSNATMIVGNTMQDDQNNQTESPDLGQIQASKALVSTYSEIVKSKGVAENVIANLDLDMDYEDFSNKVSIEPVNDTQIISVKVVDTIPARAMDIANETSMIFKNSITKIMNVDNVQILDKATMPEEPSSPNVIKNTVIGAMLGFILGIGIALIKELSDTRIKTTADITENFDIPVLGLVPDSKKSRRK